MRLSIAWIPLAAALTLCACGGQPKQTATDDYVSPAPAFNADSAMSYVAAQCGFGPRVMNSAAHDSCAVWLQRQFERLGADVTMQRTTVTLYDGTTAPAVNIIASCNPQAGTRIMVCSHWDSRPWADNDPDERYHHTPIDGANDGASGVGVLLELARLMQQQAPAVGVDLICFDAEDCGTPQWADDGGDHENTWCLGSQYWAAHHHAEGYQARYGILLDMVGGAGTEFRKEFFSMRYAPAVVDKVWAAARRIGMGDYFSYDEGSAVTDDHLPVNRSGIPCIDVIAHDKDGRGFCATWHTIDDNFRHIDRQTLHAVGQTLAEVIYTEE